MPDDATNWIHAGIRGMASVGRRRVDPELHRMQWNENAEGFPAALRDEVLKRLSVLDWARYPHGLRPWVLIERLAAYSGVHPDQVVVSDGSSDLIKLVMAATLAPGDVVVMPNPTFLLYGLNAQMQQAKVVDTPLQPEDDFALPAQRLVEASHAHKARLVVICAPNNPTGTRYSAETLAYVAQNCHGLLLIDEAYAEFCEQNLTHLLANGRVVLLRTLSKVFAMAGVRVGYLLSSPALASEFQKVVTDFPLSVFGEITAEVALDHVGSFMEQRDHLIAERERLANALRQIPNVRVFSSATNFLLVRVMPPKQALLDYLHHQHALLISDMADYPGMDDYIRISIGTPAQNDLVIRGITECYAEHLPR